MFNTNKSTISIRIALLAGATAASMASIGAFAANDEQQVERIQVTGSRIKTTDLEGSSPVTTINISDIDKTGQMSVADLLRSSNLNTFGSTSEQSGNASQSQASVSLRGVGADRTLVLLNGKRMPGSPTLGGTAVNLNALPTAAVERIEILSDGASAIYGSDAIAGVVNIITKKGYDGLEISATKSNPTQPGGEEWKASVIGGVSGDKGNVTFSVEHQQREIIFQRDRWFSSSTNLDAKKYSDVTGVSTYARNFNDSTSYVTSPLAGCKNPDMVGDGHIYDAEDGDYVCGYDYTSQAADHAARKYDAGFVNADYQISDDVRFEGQAIYSRNQTFGRYAPAAGKFKVDAGAVDVQHYDASGNYVNTTKNEHAGQALYRFTGVGTRDSTTTDYTTDLQLGFVGEHDSFGWDATYHYSLQENNNNGTGYVHRPTVEALVKDGKFNFGPEGNTPEVIAAITHDVFQQDAMEFQSVNAGINFDGADLLGAGEMGLYFGTEFMKYKYTSKVDAESANGEIIGSAGNGSSGDRDVSAAFGEMSLPITDDLSLSAALRYDKYSDFGSAVTPKASIRYAATDDLVLRASWGKGFRAPSLSDLYAADSFSADFATDYHYCEQTGKAISECRQSQYDVTRTANEDLEAETSDFYNVGAIWDITDNFSTKIEYYNLKIDNVITFVSLDSLLSEEKKVGYGNLALGNIKRFGDNPNGKIEEATTPQVNGNSLATSGIDFNLAYRNLETSIGDFSANIDTTYVIDYSDEEYFNGPVHNKIGRNGLPQIRSTATLDWELGDNTASLVAHYIDSQTEKTDPNTYEQLGHLSSQTTFDASYGYATSWNGKVSIGVRNLTNEDPVLDSNIDYDKTLYNLYGRTYNLSYTQMF
ncbi:TonB-dependent receptor [Shewanella gelidimarina]|uniref:TonB-dependent receptor plug domain-containing protein n=1 Tax=Shewanella gelidimarina TaxID=56813 RepID=UPI00200D4D3F|nr:TonB-dependent receptor [Shewanella gelidimarina]MCL1058859.1 TonB-dependent receptor [Shewanella gelidimarina]